MRPRYEHEPSELALTLAWSKKHDLNPVLELVRILVAHPLIVVASGGSVTAGDFVVRLHQSFARLPAVVLTPYEFILRPGDDVSGVLLLSAGGSNPDIVNAARHASEASHPVLSAIIGRAGSPLGSQMRDCRHAERVELDLPVMNDPLGVNSLLATVTLLSRAYASVFSEREIDVEIPTLSKRLEGAELGRPRFDVLAAGWSSPAAHHFTSECNEAALGAAWFTDYRNFAHGGYHALAQRSDETAVVAFVSPECHEVAAMTLELLPKSVPTVVVETTKEGSSGAIELLLLASQLVGAVSARADVDSDQPSVATFARELYDMDISRHRVSASRETRRQRRIDHWIERKVGGAAWGSATDDERTGWRREYEKWASLQRAANVGGVVFDYDGTICERDERFSRPGVAIAAALTRLVELGLTLGVASGRGRLLVDALKSLIPEKHWDRVSVGPYNGSLVMSLAEPFPERQHPVALMREVGKILQASPLISALAKVSYAGELQVTAIEVKPLPAGMLRRIVLEALAGEPEVLDSVSAQSSGLTVDVIGRGASKRRVVDHLAAQMRSDSPADQRQVFAIGDQGSLDGNDFTLLSHSHSLSVHKVSSRFDQCWNLARPGRRGSVAFIDYLDAVVPREDGGNTFAFDVDSLESA
jgi:hydroxymethylpyrimidine pyrophosphatase-like HAD family hydrolase/fructoselysine-6-P-deglycase FrlB-like protein